MSISKYMELQSSDANSLNVADNFCSLVGRLMGQENEHAVCQQSHLFRCVFHYSNG